MRVLCWALLTISATAAGAACWLAWHYQSVVIAMVALHGVWVTHQALRAVIGAHRLTCRKCKRWQPGLTASGFCERCFCEQWIEGASDASDRN
jgi:hypothetical protein